MSPGIGALRVFSCGLKSHLLLVSTLSRPSGSFYQPLIRPCDISSKVTYPWRGGVKYERYFHAMLRLNCACAKSTSWYLSAYFYRHARAYLTCPRVLGRGYLPHCTSRPLVAPARGSARLRLVASARGSARLRPLVASARGSAQNEMQLQEFQATALSGRRVDFSSFAGKPVLFVNVASE